ncbi:MAG: OmpA family protein [Spirochaetales bacterium]|nr:OmpA family protein [Spirochaetales bacterium]
MLRSYQLLLIVGALALTLTGCPSQPPAQPTVNTPPAAAAKPDVNSIQPEKGGFSPKADAPNNFLTFDLKFADAKDVQSWKVTFQNPKDGVQRTLTGTAAKLPPTLTWDGRTDAGKLAPEATYTASLSVDYGKVRAPDTQTSIPFVLDITPPSDTITIKPEPYFPSESLKDTLHIQITTKNGGGQVVNWRLQIIDPDGTVFKNFISEDHRDGDIVWDGRSDSNGLLKPNTTYKVLLSIFDEWGNRAEAYSQLQVGPSKDKNVRPEIPSGPIIFKANTANYTDLPRDLARRNEYVLNELATQLRKYGSAAIVIEGHANKVFWWNKAKGDREQQDVLIPLSRERAEAVRRALIERGIPADQLHAIGVGADDPVVPFSDKGKTWENRRVVFYLK